VKFPHLGKRPDDDRNDEEDVESDVKKDLTASFGALDKKQIESILELRQSEGWAALHQLLALERRRITRMLRSPKVPLESIRFIQGMLAGTDDVASLVEVEIPEWYNKRRPKGPA